MIEAMTRITRIDLDKKYTIQTYSFHHAVITVYEECYNRTEIEKPTKPNKHGHMASPTTNADGTEHYYKYENWQDVIAVVPLQFSYDLDWDDTQKLEQVLETVEALKKAYRHYPDGEVGVTYTMNTSCVNHE
jgi:hypothetical protein|tara:strand:- start:147 stop:542 length:396 start_codon:yes stop_codon:yes gene_type:complete